MEEIDFRQLKQLWTLKIVVETGSIKRTAAKTNVTSSAVSQSISRLEEQLGRKLLIRKKEELIPTEHANQLLQSATSAFNVCLDLQKGLSPTCQLLPKMTWLDFAATESLAIDILPKLMLNLRTQLPNLRLKVKTGRSSALTMRVKKNELCMALVEENEYMDGVTSIPIAEDRLGFFCSPDNVQTHDSRIFNKLGVGTLAPGPEGHPLFFSKVIKILGTNFRPTLISESYEVLRTAAVEGSIIALLPSRVANRRTNDLVEIFPTKESYSKLIRESYKIYLVCEPNCSAEENEFLAKEIKSLISAQSKN